MITCHVSFAVTSFKLFGLQYILLNLLGNYFRERKKEGNIVNYSKSHASKIQGESDFIV